jgi:hypothetical protein
MKEFKGFVRASMITLFLVLIITLFSTSLPVSGSMLYFPPSPEYQSLGGGMTIMGSKTVTIQLKVIIPFSSKKLGSGVGLTHAKAMFTQFKNIATPHTETRMNTYSNKFYNVNTKIKLLPYSYKPIYVDLDKEGDDFLKYFERREALGTTLLCAKSPDLAQEFVSDVLIKKSLYSKALGKDGAISVLVTDGHYCWDQNDYRSIAVMGADPKNSGYILFSLGRYHTLTGINKLDLVDILTHEIYHVIGLGHDERDKNLMNAELDPKEEYTLERYQVCAALSHFLIKEYPVQFLGGEPGNFQQWDEKTSDPEKYTCGNGFQQYNSDNIDEQWDKNFFANMGKDYCVDCMNKYWPRATKERRVSPDCVCKAKGVTFIEGGPGGGNPPEKGGKGSETGSIPKGAFTKNPGHCTNGIVEPFFPYYEDCEPPPDWQKATCEENKVRMCGGNCKWKTECMCVKQKSVPGSCATHNDCWRIIKDPQGNTQMDQGKCISCRCQFQDKEPTQKPPNGSPG